ncbi:MAG: alpha/beta hydrolase-fold protein [Planctomycetaceae bacterium]
MHSRMQHFLRSLISACLALLLCSALAVAQDHPDRTVQPGVPQGKITSGEFRSSQIFPGTTRNWSLYVPAQYAPDKPASLMVFMDGAGYAKTDGAFRVPVVFDNLIHQQAMPVTIAVFVNPGVIPAELPGAADRSNRSFEYDSLGDRYVRFLLDEFLPEVLQGLNVSANPRDRAVGGISSGAICAFTAAWERPDQFGRVLSHIGSYTNIRGGWEYASLVRKTKEQPKPIRVYLQEGREDLNNLHGHWPLSNHELAAALQFAGYQYQLEMTDGGHSGKAAGERLPEALKWLWSDASGTVVHSQETKPEWTPHPDAVVRDGVPQGRVEELPAWESQIFPGTTRRISLYVPAQYRPETPAALMVFQDGERFRDVRGRWRVPVVFDNLIASGEMSPTIAVFIDPGHDKTTELKNNRASNRSFEYDSLGDRYVRFLLEEILPEVRKKYAVSDDPNLLAIGGSSSGAICAFNAAWERPDVFGRVYSSVGSFTNLRGGSVYPSLVRKTEPKPIRVYMADTSGDIDNQFGSWPWANQQMAAALKYMGYDVKFDWAEGYAHNSDFSGARFPDAMRWLWRQEKHQPVLDTRGDLGGDLTLLKLLVPGAGWELAAADLGFADALCADSNGNLYYCDMKAPAVFRISAADGSQALICRESVSGMELTSEGLLIACQGSKKRIISIDPATGETQVLAENVVPNDLALGRNGWVYFTDTGAGAVKRFQLGTNVVSTVDEGISKPNGIAVSGDGGTLAVSDYGGRYTWTFRIRSDGTLDAKMPTMPMRLPINQQGEFRMSEPPPYLEAAKGDGMAVDAAGRYYVTSALGVQVFDPTGRPCGVLPVVHRDQPLTTCILAGSDFNTLYIAHGTRLYRRKLTVK